MLWDNTVNKAYRVKGQIQPLQNAVADGVRRDIAVFGEEVRDVFFSIKEGGNGVLNQSSCLTTIYPRTLELRKQTPCHSAMWVPQSKQITRSFWYRRFSNEWSL